MRLPSSLSFRRTMSSFAPSTLNPRIKNVQYAVRGELAIKSEKYREMLKNPNHGLPFNKVITANIGNPQQKGLDQPPLTFGRQVAALLEYPPLMDSGKNIFPADTISRAKELYSEIGSIGAYSQSQGIPFIRKSVADFIERRDGYPSNPNHIFLTAGASSGVNLLINFLISDDKSGVLIPIPQYPLYTATLAQYGGIPLPYYLDETERGWGTSTEEVERAIKKGIEEGVKPKALAIINPGNPVGSVLTYEEQESLVKLCEKYSIVLLADEVYQSNIHTKDAKFTSFKKVVGDLKSNVALVSFHSISKGVTGECGRRGGYFECVNVPDETVALLYKMVSVGLCPTVGGQVGVDCMVRPPVEGEESYELWKKETDTIHKALAERTHLMAARLNVLPGMSCAPSPGALYLFPRLHLPEKALQAAKEAGRTPDNFYAIALLDQTGICVVSGDGFGQKEGQAHFRLTCLCSGVEAYVDQLEKFHRAFMQKYE